MKSHQIVAVALLALLSTAATAADVPSKWINVATSEKWGRHELKAGSRAVGKLGQDIKAWPPIFKY
jgi:hypothetical protein